MTDKRIIALAVDGSEHAEYAFEWYRCYFHHPDQEMVIFYIPEDCDFAKIRYFTYLHNSCNTLFIIHAFDGSNLEKIQKEIAKGGPMKENLELQYSKIADLEDKYHTKMQRSKINGRVLSIPAKNPGQSIIEAAREEGAFALIMGTRGRNKLKKVLLGSVSDYVVKNADIPVIVVRKHEATSPKV